MEKHAASPEKAHALLAELVTPNLLARASAALSVGLPVLGMAALLYSNHQTQQELSNELALREPRERCFELELRVLPTGAAPYDSMRTLEWRLRVQPGSWLTVAQAAFERVAPAAVE